MTTIDDAAVPTRVFMDSGVMFRAFGDRPNEAWAPACEKLLEHCLETGKAIGISTASIAEFVRHRGGRRFMRVQGIEPVAFDLLAAETLGAKMPMAMLSSLKTEHGHVNDYWKYDALIVATALRWGAELLVSHDIGLRGMAAAVGLSAKSPIDLVKAQQDLF